MVLPFFIRATARVLPPQSTPSLRLLPAQSASAPPPPRPSPRLPARRRQSPPRAPPPPLSLLLPCALTPPPPWEEEEAGRRRKPRNFATFCLSHLRELRPSAAAASSFVPSSTVRLEPLPLDVKVYDANRVRVGSSEGELDEGRTMCKVAANTAPLRRIEKAVNPDVARLIDESDVSHNGSDDEGLAEDFVIVANRAEGERLEEEDMNGVFSDAEEEELDFEEDDPKPRVRRLLDEQFDLKKREAHTPHGFIRLMQG